MIYYINIKQSKAKRGLHSLINNSFKIFLIILLSFILSFLVGCNNKDKTGGSDNGGVGVGVDNVNTDNGTSGSSGSNGGDSSSEAGGSSGSYGGSSSGGDSSDDSGSGDSGSGEESSGEIAGTTSGSTGSGKKSDLEGEWSGYNCSFGITNGKLSMSLFWGPIYEGQIPDSFNYPFSILATGTLNGETKTGIFTFYSATNGAYYYYNASGSRLLGNIEKKGSSGSGGSSSGEVSSSGITNYDISTSSGVKSELTGNWYAGGYDNFNIIDGKLSMSSSTPTYEGQIPNSFNYPLNIVLTGINGGETKTAIFTFYSATNGACYYYRVGSPSVIFTGNSYKLSN